MSRELLDRNIRIRLNQKEDQALVYLAFRAGVRYRSRIVRKMIREAIGEGPDLLKEDLNVFREAVRQLGALGRNLNQIARAVNAGQTQGLELNSALLNSVRAQVELMGKEVTEVVLRSRLRWVKHA